jgi:hypothetical protein
MLRLCSSHVLRLGFVRNLVTHRQEHFRLLGLASLTPCSLQPCAVSFETVLDDLVGMNWLLASLRSDVGLEVAQNFANPSGSHSVWALLWWSIEVEVVLHRFQSFERRVSLVAEVDQLVRRGRDPRVGQ